MSDVKPRFLIHRITHHSSLITLFVTLHASLLTSACDGLGGSGVGLAGLRPTKDVNGGTGDGVKVAWEPLAKPDPRIPFPNNVLTRFDPDAITGLKVNLPLDASTELENSVRRGLNELDGFGTYAPITVPFDGPINVNTVRYNALDPADRTNSVYLIRIDTLDASPVDLGEGFFPFDVKGGADDYWANDPLKNWPSFLYHPFNRALFNLGREKPLELKAMLESGKKPMADPARGSRWEFFDYSSNTLLFRPLEPLVEKSKYAVILTTRIHDLNDQSIRSPFDSINHVFQTESLRPVWDGLDRFGLIQSEVAFMWAYTTQCVSCDLVQIRQGMDGQGPFARLRQMFPARILTLYDLSVREPLNARDVKLIGFQDRPDIERDENPYILRSSFLAGLVNDIFNGALKSLVAGAIGEAPLPLEYQTAFHNVDYSVFGSFISPSFVENERGVFSLNAATGEFDARMMEDPWDGDRGIPFVITVPKPTRENNCGPPPYPVVIYGHGNTASGFTALFQANYLARYCIATAGLDYYGHGPLFDLFRLFENLPTDRDPNLDDVAKALEPFGVDAESLGNVAGIDVSALVPAITGLATTILNGSIFPMIGLEPPRDQYKHIREVSDALKSVGLFRALLFYGRSHDTNGDGVRDQGDSFFDVNIQKTRDHFRQSAVDAMQFARVIKNFCRDNDRNGKLDMMEGNFDLDEEVGANGLIGTCDVGGPDREIYYTSTSLGGIIGSILTGVDPLVTRSALTVPGGGLLDILIRTSLGSVAKRVYFGIVGTTVVGRPVEKDGQILDGVIGLSVNETGGKGGKVKVKDLACDVKEECELPILDGSTVIIHNVRSGEARRFTAGPNPNDPAWDFVKGGNFSGRVAADPGDTIVVTVPAEAADGLTLPAVVLPQDACRYVRSQYGWPCAQFKVKKGQEGLGTDRNSSHLTFLASVAQTVMERADPINYAPFYNVRPLADVGPKKVVIQVSTGDMTVPINTGVALARAAGYIDHLTHLAFVKSGLAYGYALRQQACMVLDPGATCFGSGEEGTENTRAPLISELSWTKETRDGRYFSGFRPYNADQHAWYLLPIPYEDIGRDGADGKGIFNSSEDGYDPYENPDPSGDNYCPETNANGPEGNRRLDGFEDESIEGDHAKGNGYLDIDLTQAAQQQAGTLFRYGYIRNVTPTDPDAMMCECFVNDDIWRKSGSERLDGFVTDSLEECVNAGGHLSCITNPLCREFGSPPWWP
ncbi:MAG: hypothetical protein HYT87_02385 [Nitrospirae bacterium]|nr:hypothetical protein [Nitrospirota bacterium]